MKRVALLLLFMLVTPVAAAATAPPSHDPYTASLAYAKCMRAHGVPHPDPDRRYQTANALAEDLRALIEDRPLRHAPELSRVERVQKWSRRHPRLTTTALVGAVSSVLLLALAGGLAMAWTGWADTREQLASAESREQVQQFDANAYIAQQNAQLAFL